MRADIAKIESAVKARLDDDFRNVKILKIDVLEDVDYDGDKILKIQVVFEGKPSDLDGRALSSSIRHVRDALSKIDVFQFPSLSFITAKDAGILARA